MNTFRLRNGILLAVIAYAAHGASRNSVDYIVPADTLDAGACRTLSVSYVNDASLGGFASISQALAPDQVAKHGFIGQLYEVRTLQVHGIPAPVNEGATLQLGASLACDDDTQVALVPASVLWSVVEGPPSSITPRGLLTAGRVYADTELRVRGTHLVWAGLWEAQVMNVDSDDYGRYAGDGLPDDWQVVYFGLDDPTAAAPTADPDSDGQDNLFEYTAGLVPTSESSRFRLAVTVDPFRPGQVSVVFSPRLADRTYGVEYRDSLSAGKFAPLVGGASSDEGPERTVIDEGASTRARFYRVQISLP